MASAQPNGVSEPSIEARMNSREPRAPAYGAPESG